MKTKIYLLLSVFFIFVTMGLAQSDCHALYQTISQDGQYIYFSSSMETDNYQIYRSDLDGSDIVRLTYSNENDILPDESPDGKWIVFQKGNYGAAAEIYLMKTDGSDLTQLTDNDGFDGSPRFSPDSYKIVYSAWDDSPYPEVFTMDIDGENKTALTAEPGATYHHNPVYSPDGNYIYFAQGLNANNHIVRMTADGSSWSDITLPNDFGYDEAWFDINHDGSKLVMQSSEYKGYNNGFDIFILNADGSDWNVLSQAEDSEYFVYPKFSPQGDDNHIYFTYLADLSSKYEIKRMTFEGLDLQSLLICNTSSVNEGADLEILIYPNPSSTMIYVETDVQFKELSISDVQGKRIFQRPFCKQFSIDNLDAGFYFVEFRGQYGALVRTKLVVEK